MKANQFRALLTLAAYLLFQGLRRRAATTPCADAQATTPRERLIKLAVYVERSARRIVLHLPLTFPWLSTWRHLARAVGARRNGHRARRVSSAALIESSPGNRLRAAERGAVRTLGPIVLTSVCVHE